MAATPVNISNAKFLVCEMSNETFMTCYKVYITDFATLGHRRHEAEAINESHNRTRELFADPREDPVLRRAYAPRIVISAEKILTRWQDCHMIREKHIPEYAIVELITKLMEIPE